MPEVAGPFWTSWEAPPGPRDPPTPGRRHGPPAVTGRGRPAAALRDQLSLVAASRRMWKNGDCKMKRADSIMTRPRPMMPISDQICG
jgi:hypothetical protein